VTTLKESVDWKTEVDGTVDVGKRCRGLVKWLLTAGEKSSGHGDGNIYIDPLRMRLVFQ
jgi:hypothetical protein